MNKRLEGKVAVVTGSGRGIGKGIALKLGEEGAKVVINYSRNVDNALEVVESIEKKGSKAAAVKADVTKVKEICQLFDETVAQFGRLDILVSNAGVEHFGRIEEVTEEEFDTTFAVNTRGQFFAMREAVKKMNNGGRIICLSSVSTAIAFPKHAVYAGSKAAIEAFVRGLAVDLGACGITVNAVAPGATQTDMSKEYADFYLEPGLNAQQQAKKMTPLGRFGKPVDIANVVAFLASDEGAWITGQTIRVNGGMA